MGRFESDLPSFFPNPNPNPKSIPPLQWRHCSPSSAAAAPAAEIATSFSSNNNRDDPQPPKSLPFATAVASFADPELDDRSDDEDMESSAALDYEAVEAETLWSGNDLAASLPRKSRFIGGSGGGVMLEGYVEAPAAGGDGGSDDGSSSVGRTKSLTDDDLEELKGCLDLGFGFNYDEIPELCSTLPALELCYSMSRSLERSGDGSGTGVAAAEQCLALPAVALPPIANWKISNPGDDPEDVKARLKYWAQAVACTVRLCS